MPEETAVQDPEVSNLTDEELDKLTASEPEASTPEVKTETPPATPPAEQKPAEAPKQAPTLEELQRQMAEITANHDRALKQLRDKEQFIQRQGNEIGNLRKERLTWEQFKKQNDEKALDSPTEAALELQTYLKGEEQEQQRQYQTAVTFNRECVSQFVKDDLESLIPEIGKILVEDDGLTKEMADSFVRLPWVEPPSTVIANAKRVLLKRELTQAKAELETLRKEVETLKKKPDEALRRVQLAANQTRPISAAAGGTPLKDTPTKPLHEMTDAELDKLIETNG